ncbi:hypothetical protein D3C72_1527770 [compost metagenome]
MIAASTPATNAPVKIVVNGGSFRSARTTTTTSGRNNSSDISNEAWMAAALLLVSKSPEPPSIQNTASAIAKAMVEVSAVSRTCT